MTHFSLSTDFWYALMMGSLTKPDILVQQMIAALKSEVPDMCSVTMERACNLQCQHCIYPYERSSYRISQEVNLSDLVLRAAQQLSGRNPKLLHEGRIIRPWHIEILSRALRARPDLKIGLIDNGTYITLIDEFKRQGLQLDWLDISIDGPEKIHNIQRDNKGSFKDALMGLQKAREIVKPKHEGGRVSSLFTITKVNHEHIEDTAKILFQTESFIEQWHISTLSPARKPLIHFEQFDLKMVWEQIRRVFDRYGYDEKGEQRIFLRFFRHQEILKLLDVVGVASMVNAFMEGVRVASGEINFCVEGIPILYAPLSLWPSETFLIDADGAYRTAYSGAYTLEQLHHQDSLKGYTVCQLKQEFNLIDLYHRCVDQWWNFKGRQYLEEEMQLFQKIRNE